MNRIDKTFRRLRRKGQKAFIPYVMAGDPSIDDTRALVGTLEEAGADIVELGVPFTDPLADGPVIQRAAERALKGGVTLKKVLALVSGIRGSSEIPIVLMTYFNPVYKYGTGRLLKDAAGAGVDGLIVPDLPPEEAGDFIKDAKREGVATIFLAAPTSTQERISKVVKASSGFIYYVSITGITGSALGLEGLTEAVGTIKALTDKPVAVGFGVSTPEEAAAVAKAADGVIVGSAIVKRAHEDGVRSDGLMAFLKGLRAAL